MVHEGALGRTPHCRRGPSFRHAQGEFGREERRPIWGAIIGAVGALAASGVSAYGQSQAAKKVGGRSIEKLKQPDYAQGMQHYIAQLLSRNATAQAPTFADYVQSGGTATFPLEDPGLTPTDARRLGFVGRRNEPVPYVTADQTQLTPEQLMFAIRQGGANFGPALDRYGRVASRLDRVGNLLEAGGLTPGKEAKLERKQGRLQSKEARIRRRIFGGS